MMSTVIFVIQARNGQNGEKEKLADSRQISSTEFARGLSCAGPKEAWSLEQGWEQVGCGSAPPSNRVAQDTICPLPPFVPRPANDNCLRRDTLQIMAWDTTCKSQH